MKKLLPIVLLLLSAAACNFPGLGAPPPAPEPVVPQPATGQALGSGPSEVDPSASPIPQATSGPALKDLTIRPQIWFGPLDPWSWNQHFPGAGPFQYYDLFTEGAPWQQVSEAVHVIRLYPAWLDSYATPAQIQAVLADIAQRGIAISYEGGPLTETPLCNAATVEGFSGVPSTQRIVDRISAAGGTLYSMDLQHAFDAGTYADPNCRMTPEEIAADAFKTVTAVRAVFPEVKIGSIETADLDPEAVATWLAAYYNVTGTELDYFHLDINFARPDWATRALAIQEVVNRRGIEFGIIYFGDEGDSTDAEWLAHAEERIVTYEVLTGGRPDHAIFQSWHPHPQKLFPETDPDAFTHLILRYIRPRTILTLEHIDDFNAGGRLSTEDGSPVAGARVQVRLRPTEGEGVFADYVITGIVPQEAQFAGVGFRVNTECDCSHFSEFVLEQAVYLEGEQTVNGVPNGNFANGMNGWGMWGSGKAGIVPSSNGTGGALKVSVSEAQFLGLNSGEIAVTPGSTFTVTFTARINPASAGSGYFAIFFLTPTTEIRRMEVPIQAGDILLGEALTDQNGDFQLNLGDLPSGAFALIGWFEGDAALWPAYAHLDGQQ